MHWYAGTSGYSYPAWKGPFYPEDTSSERMLAYYATRLPTVEINNTFYRMPRSSVLDAWAAAVPESFRFVIKASRRITHQQRLKDAADPTRYLLDKLTVLGDKLGAVLFQLPPNLRADRERLAVFLDLLAGGPPAAFEFRHPSWLEPEIRELLAAAGVALCLADAEDAATPELVATAPWTYLRLRRPGYDDAALQGWQRRVEDCGVERAFVFFKHEDDGAAPAMAQRFLAFAAGREDAAPALPPKRVAGRPRQRTRKQA